LILFIFYINLFIVDGKISSRSAILNWSCSVQVDNDSILYAKRLQFLELRYESQFGVELNASRRAKPGAAEPRGPKLLFAGSARVRRIYNPYVIYTDSQIDLNTSRAA
jgi:hypothetical protein